MKKIRCWHFLAEDKRLRWGTQEVVKAGKTYTCKGDIVLCKNGLHGSERILGALDYAPGPWCCEVDIWGDVVQDNDKLAGRNRHVLSMFDATETLREFARWCALQVIDKWDSPDVVRRYLETGDESIRAAAWDAARDSARAAARAAARDAAWAAAWDATWDSARAAAWDAAKAAAWDSAWDSARAAARDAQNARLEEMVRSALTDKEE